MVRRITTGGLMKSYKSNLMRSYKNLADVSEKVTTERNFNSYAESPAKAAQAFQLRHSRWNVESQIDNSKQVTHKFQQAWDCLSAAYRDLANGGGKFSTLVGLNAPTASGRQALGETIKGTADSILLTMNAKYGDRFVFSGADGDQVPFSWDTDGKTVLYRGIPVNGVDKDGNESPDPTDPNAKTYKEMLEDTLKEETLVDLGMGMKEQGTSEELIKSSAFNTALNGLTFLGYGTDGEGDPKNVISLMMELGEIFSNCDPDSGDYANPGDYERAEELLGKFQDSLNNLHAEWMKEDVDAKYVKNNQIRLESLDDSYNEQIVSIEDIDPVDAITALMWAQYSYNAALRIGNGILSQSLIDYMN